MVIGAEGGGGGYGGRANDSLDRRAAFVSSIPNCMDDQYGWIFPFHPDALTRPPPFPPPPAMINERSTD